LTQPAVTLLLRELEDKLGLRLFERTTRHLQRTEAAAEAYAHAERVLAELDEMGQNLSGLARGHRGRIHIAATSTLAQTLLPPVIREFTERWPQVRVALDDCSPGEFVELIRTRRVTFGVGTLETAFPHAEETVLRRDHLVAAAPRPGVFSSNRPISWKQLASHPLVIVKPGYGVRRSIERAAQDAGVTLQVAHEVSMLSTALAMAAAGLGVAVVPSSVLAYSPYAGLASRRLTHPEVVRNTSVIHERGRSLSPAALAFIELMKQAAQRPRPDPARRAP
jgi:LysR family transcriptional regulator, carnitine catabolism transcriptional activator